MPTLAPDILKIVGGGLVGSLFTLVVSRINEWRKTRDQDRQAMLRAALRLLEWTQLRALFPDKSPVDFQREEWRVLFAMSEAVGSVSTRRYLKSCAAVTNFGFFPASRTDDRAKQIARNLLEQANPALTQVYLAQFGEHRP